jgi:hypothetical protein
MGQYQNPGPNQPGNPTDRNILLTNKEEILLQTHGHQYGLPLESTPTTSEATPSTTRQPLMIPHPNNEPNPRIPRMPLRHNVHNPHARASHNYSLVDDLAQSPTTMSVLGGPPNLSIISGNPFFPPWGQSTQLILDSSPLI